MRSVFKCVYASRDDKILYLMYYLVQFICVRISKFGLESPTKDNLPKKNKSNRIKYNSNREGYNTAINFSYWLVLVHLFHLGAPGHNLGALNNTF